MSRKILSDEDHGGITRILGLPAPVDGAEPARLSDLNSAIEGLAAKDNVRVATQANLDLSTPGATIDGVTMAANDRVLLKAQTAAAQNGLYIWSGAATPLTRAPDANTADELENAVVSVDEGTNEGTTWRQTAFNFTLDTDPVAFVPFGVVAPPASETTPGLVELATQGEVDAGTDPDRVVTAATLAGYVGRARRASADVGDGSATQFDVTHNFGTRDVIVSVRRAAAPYDVIACDVEPTTTNAVRLIFAAAPTPGQFRVTIIA